MNIVCFAGPLDGCEVYTKEKELNYIDDDGITHRYVKKTIKYKNSKRSIFILESVNLNKLPPERMFYA